MSRRRIESLATRLTYTRLIIAIMRNLAQMGMESDWKHKLVAIIIYEINVIVIERMLQHTEISF